ncbi:MAG TPA: FmdB family zinc ribbon protein [Streptosporangiaceae bacterium]|nr:FmdB family zinc ribbon protein [Streptosporangiaceae bacterium]
MPTYQYTCTDCGEPVEAVQKFTDDPLTVCAVCGGRLRKVFSPVGIVFKGSGFYRTDSRNSSVAADAKKDKQDRQDKQPAESAKSGESSNGSSGKADKADKTAVKKSEPVSTSSRSSGEKVA